MTAGDFVWESSSISEIGRDVQSVLEILAAARGLAVENGAVRNLPYEDVFHNAELIPDFTRGIERVILAKEQKEKVAIFGDYDVDGVTSTAILAETFENIGIATKVFLPHRADDGYGLSVEMAEKIAGVAELLVTIDNGTSSHQAIAKAKSLGLDVLVIDHHTVQETLPAALVINPHRADSNYPFTELCAAGLAFKFARALLTRFDREDEAKWLLDLAALGTIADRVILTDENREIVRFGLKVLGVTRRLGLLALIARAGLYKKNLDAETLAFKIIPRLNAAGRMQHADLAYALLHTKDHLEAEKLALELDALNNSRRTLTAGAIKEIKEELVRSVPLPEVICVAGNWPIGVVGLLAGKLADEFNRPAAVINKGEEFCTGSIRGNGLTNIVDILSGAKNILTKFGGHFSAGGFSFATKDWKKVEKYFKNITLAPSDGAKKCIYDLEISKNLIDLDLIEALKTLEPFGEGNKRPVFLLKNLRVNEVRDIGAAREHKRLLLAHSDFCGGTLAGVAFHWKERQSIEAGREIDALCELKLNEFRGNASIDLMIVDLRKSVML